MKTCFAHQLNQMNDGIFCCLGWIPIDILAKEETEICEKMLFAKNQSDFETAVLLF